MCTSIIAFSPPFPFSISIVARVLSRSFSMLDPPGALSLLTTSGVTRTTARRARSSFTLKKRCFANVFRAREGRGGGGGG